MTHQAGEYPGFHSMKRLRVSLHPLDGMLVHRRVAVIIKFAASIFTFGMRGALWELLVQNYWQRKVPGQDLNPAPRCRHEQAKYEATCSGSLVRVDSIIILS